MTGKETVFDPEMLDENPFTKEAADQALII